MIDPFAWPPVIPFPYTLGLFYVFHKVGDYMLQTSYMALNKYRSWDAAIYHAIAYTSIHVFLTHDIPDLLFIGITHLLIDRYRLAALWVAFINKHWHLCRNWEWIKQKPLVPPEVVLENDQVMHLICNAIALFW